MLAARAAGAPPPREVERAVAGLFRSIADLLNPRGSIPQVGDLDSCRGLPLMPRAALDCEYLAALGAAALRDAHLKRAACPVEVAWLLGPEGVRRFEALAAEARTGSVELPDAGVAVLRSEHAPNNFPQLPVREDADVLVVITRFDSHDELPASAPAAERLILEPTARSALR